LHRYQKTQTIHGLPQPAGLSHCEQLPQAIYTPSTKAELGDKDINISPEEAKAIVGEKYASRIEELALSCYKAGAAYAAEHGIIIVRHCFRHASPPLKTLLTVLPAGGY
jgi:phosphoribosylaminoimidazole-succinocarboxamide synthase